MFVSQKMATNLITAGPDTKLSEVREIMLKNNIRHVPVVDGEGLLIGIVSDRDMRSAMPSTLMEKDDYEKTLAKVMEHRVREIMT